MHICVLTHIQIAEPRRPKSRSTPSRLVEAAAYGQVHLLQCASGSSVFISTNATMSDLPGPGRGLDKLYSRAGKILELCIYRFAHRCGYGPPAVYERFHVSLPLLRYPFIHVTETGGKAEVSIVWDRLLEYAQ